jgi:RNA polymerase sigma-70 factor (ECF subfamily)
MNRMRTALAPRSFHGLFHDGVSTGLSDKELLERFAASRDSAGELAFATLVARHGPMVLSVCRRMLRDPHDWEDAFQATFLILVRKRAAIRFEASLGPWLYGVSVRVARRARAISCRRRALEVGEPIPDLSIAPRSATDPDLRFAIDDFLAELPATYRAAIVLCYLEGLTHEEAARRLRCPVGTVRSRLSRGRAILKERLDRAGLGIAVESAEVTHPLDRVESSAPLGTPLVDSVAQRAARFAGGEPLPRIVPAPIANLVFGATQNMTISKLAAAASFLVFAGLAAWGAAGLSAQTPGKSPTEATQPALASLSTFERFSPEQAAQPQEGGDESKISIPDDLPPVVINVEPKVGAIDVDPDLKELRVTFSKKMTDKSWSWPTGNKYAAPKGDGLIHFERDGRTCVMPVKLEPGKTYVIGVNSERFRNFKDEKGHPALPYLMVFRTKAASTR